MADIVSAILVTMSQGVPGDDAGNQQEYPIDQRGTCIDNGQIQGKKK